MEFIVIGLVYAFLKRSTSSAAPTSSYVVKPLYRDDGGFIEDQYGPPGQRAPGGPTPAPFTISSQQQAAIAAGRERIGSRTVNSNALSTPTESSGWTISPHAAQVATDASSGSSSSNTYTPTRGSKHQRDTTTDDIIDRKGL